MSLPPSGSDVNEIFEYLATCVPFDAERAKGHWPSKLDRIATQANLLGVALVVALLVFGGVRHALGSAANVLDGLLLFIGLLCAPMAGLLGVVCSTAADVMHFTEMRKQRGRYWSKAYEHDMSRAEVLSAFPQDALRAVDAYFEQKIKRVERRQARLFGGQDKLALLTLAAAAWASWKEVRALAQGVPPSWMLMGLAVLAAIALGGLALSRDWERMGYLRDLLALALGRQMSITPKHPNA